MATEDQKPKPYFKLAKWDLRGQCFHDGKTAYATEGDAVGAAVASGRYRVSEVVGSKRYDREPFTVGGPEGPVIQPPAKPKAAYPNHATRPMGGRPH